MSATEDESEMSRRTDPMRKKSLSVVMGEEVEPGPTLLQVPPKPSAEPRPGIMKSKSFASTGQYEGSIDQSSGKKLQMLAFFGQGTSGQPQTPQKTVRIRDAPVRSNSITSLTDEMMAEEDLLDIDAEFESLLNKTFEKESLRLRSSGCELPSRRGRAEEKARACPKGAVQELSSTTHRPHTHHKSSSTGVQRVSSASACDLGTPAMNPSDSVMPCAAPGSEQGRRNREHSPSPTQSEYDTCDPWDDY